jgi:hypothetical protein
MQRHTTGSAGGVQHGISAAETDRIEDELGLLAADIIGLEQEPVLHRLEPGRRGAPSGPKTVSQRKRRETSTCDNAIKAD